MGKNTAQTIQAIKLALEAIKTETIGEPKKIAISNILTKHGVNSYMLAALKDMGILKFIKDDEKGPTAYQWTYGAGAIDNSLLTKIHENIKTIHRTPKNSMRGRQHVDNEVKVISSPAKGKKRGPYNVAPAIETPKKVEKKVVTKAISVKAIVETKREERLQFTKEMGAIMGYNQLKYHSRELLLLPHDVVLHGLLGGQDAMTLNGVRAITYNVEGSDLAISFFTDNNLDVIIETPELAKHTEIRVKNKVVGLRRGGGDSKMSILHITLIPVKDPYRVI